MIQTIGVDTFTDTARTVLEGILDQEDCIIKLPTDAQMTIDKPETYGGGKECTVGISYAVVREEEVAWLLRAQVTFLDTSRLQLRDGWRVMGCRIWMRLSPAQEFACVLEFNAQALRPIYVSDSLPLGIASMEHVASREVYRRNFELGETSQLN